MGIGSEVIVKLCSQCQEGIEFYCHSCQQDLCFQCKEKHVIDLDTKHHDVTIYRERFSYIPKQVYCQTHPKQVYKEYCKRCDIPVCFHCRKHREHKTVDIKTGYEVKKQKLKKIIHSIRSDTIYNRLVLLKELKTNLKKECDNCHKNSLDILPQMELKSQRFKDNVDSAFRKPKYVYNVLKQLLSMQRTRIFNYEHGYEQSFRRPVKFLRFFKKTDIPHISDTPNPTKQCCCLRYGTQEINLTELIRFLCTILIKNIGKRQAGDQHLLRLMPTPNLQKSLYLNELYSPDLVIFVTSDEIWLNDGNNLVLKNINTGKDVHCIENLCNSIVMHTVNGKGELIYVDKDYNVNILENNMTIKTPFILEACTTWKPLRIYCSSFNGDLLLGMYKCDTETDIGKVVRYNSRGQLYQTIEHDTEGEPLYGKPYFITENTNGDVVVAELKDEWYWTVAVTTREGRLRFKYEGLHPADHFEIIGICTDALSHILINNNGDVVYMLDKDGEFLSALLTDPIFFNSPMSMRYDFNTHLLLVKSGCIGVNTVSVYRYINRNFDLTGKCDII